MRTARQIASAVRRRVRSESDDAIDPYAAWLRRQERAAADMVGAPAPRFSILVEVPDRTVPIDPRTVESMDALLGEPPTVLAVPSGQSIAETVGTLEPGLVIMIESGDLLDPLALAALAKSRREDPSSLLITFDSDRIRGGDRVEPTFRPEWSPEILLAADYIGTAAAWDRDLLLRAAGSAGLDRLGRWRALLSPELTARTVRRIPEVLLIGRHDRARPDARAAAMVTEELARRGETSEVTASGGEALVVRPIPSRWPSVSIIVPTRHGRANLDRLMPSLALTDYPGFDVTIMDNGGETADQVSWWSHQDWALSWSVRYWHEEPFNYSRVNNAGVASSSGDVVVLLNDDTEIVDPGWLRAMVGHLMRDGIGTVGLQLQQGTGLIQHGGVVIGPGGFADNTFSGMPVGSDSLIGPTDWYRDSLAVTGACVAIRRVDYDAVGGLDERFILCGSDVTLGLDQVIAGRRNVVLPEDMVRHYESVTRGTTVPVEDFFTSYWRYAPWLRNGDPYWSPNLSTQSSTPALRPLDEPAPVQLALQAVGRPHRNMAQSLSMTQEAAGLLPIARATREQVAAIRAAHDRERGFRGIASVNWFVPDIDMPFFGGVNTVFRLAAKLAGDHGVVNRFVVLGEAADPLYISTALAAAFPELADAEVIMYNGSPESVAALPPADAAVATLWLTAFHVAAAPGVRRRFYFVQDFEPGFYPASTVYGLAEESYRLGLYGICNTESLLRTYRDEYHGTAMGFAPAVDRAIYHADGRRRKSDTEPVTIFAYARDHFRNCWELVFEALTRVKSHYGDRVRIVAAGARYLPPSSDFVDLGLLDYRATGALYRETDIGVTMQISRHPSYLPLELMASGVAMVAPDSDWFDWLFCDGENAALSMRTVDGLVETIESLVVDEEKRRRVAAGGLATIDRAHSDWNAPLEEIWRFMNDPEGDGSPEGRG